MVNRPDDSRLSFRLPLGLLLSDLSERDGKGRSAKRLNQRRMLGIEVTKPIDYRRVLLFRLRRNVLHHLGRNLLGLLRCYLSLPAAQQPGKPRSSASCHHLRNNGRAECRNQSVDNSGALRATRIHKELLKHLSKGRRLIGAEGCAEPVGQRPSRRGASKLIKIIIEGSGRLISLRAGVLLQHTAELIHSVHLLLPFSKSLMRTSAGVWGEQRWRTSLAHKDVNGSCILTFRNSFRLSREENFENSAWLVLSEQPLDERNHIAHSLH